MVLLQSIFNYLRFTILGAAYQVEMIKCLKDANIDHQSVGWYQAAYLGSFVTESLIETQFKYQQNRKKAVVLVFGKN